MPKRKIDTHQHFLPKLYVDAVGLDLLNAAMPGGVAPTWKCWRAIAIPRLSPYAPRGKNAQGIL